MPITTLRKWFGVELVEVSATEKLIASLGGGLSILVLAGFSHWVLPGAGATAVIASMGASAVLLFAVPHGQLSQPWPILAGHTISATIGVACAHCIPQPAVAAACAVGLAIGAMHQLLCQPLNLLIPSWILVRKISFAWPIFFLTGKNP